MSSGHTIEGARHGRAARVAQAAVWAGHDGAILTCAGIAAPLAGGRREMQPRCREAQAAGARPGGGDLWRQ